MRVTYPFYFGCHKEAGHFWWEQAAQKPDVLVRAHGRAPHEVSNSIDGLFCPPSDVPNGVAKLTHIRLGYDMATVLSFWDNTIDKRPGSHSTFLLPGLLAFPQAVTMARAAFPEIGKRFTFNITEWRPF